MKINLFKSFSLLLVVAGLSGCKLPHTARYSPEWEVKTSVADGELPVPVTLEGVTDSPLPSPDDKGSNLIETVDENGLVTTQANGSSLDSSDLATVPLAGGTLGQASGPETQHPGEPPMPHEGGPRFGVRIRDTLLPTEEELRKAPAAMKVESSLSVTEAAPVLRSPGIPHTMHSVPSAPAAGRDPKLAPAEVSAASFAAPVPNAAPATAPSTPTPVRTPDQAAAQAPVLEATPAVTKTPEKPASETPAAAKPEKKVESAAAPAPAKKEPTVAKKSAGPKIEIVKAAPKQEPAKAKTASAEKSPQAKKPAPAVTPKTEDSANEIAKTPLPKAEAPRPVSSPAPAAHAAPAPTPASAQEKAKQESADAKSGSDLADILALAKKVEAKTRPANSAPQ